VNDSSPPVRTRARGQARRGNAAWLADVADSACRDVGDVPVELLGDYLPLLADAATTGRESDPAELDAIGFLGRRAAEMGVSARSAIQLYLSAAAVAAAAGRRPLPASEVVRAAAAVLHVVDEAVARLAEGYNDARRQMVRWEETLRREFLDDLLRSDADVGRLVVRAEPLGLDMARPHQVALAAPARRLNEAAPAISDLERAVVQWAGDRDVLSRPRTAGSSRSPRPRPTSPVRALARKRSATSCSPSWAAPHAVARGASPSDAPTPAPTGSLARTKKPEKA